MNYTYKQQWMNKVRVYAENQVIGSEFIRLIDEVGYENAVKTLKKIAELSATVDYMINKEKAYKLIELLKTEESAKRFDMTQFFNINDIDVIETQPVCGTAACIAGHTVLMEYPDAKVDYCGDVLLPNDSEESHEAPDLAANTLNLDSDEAYWLFYGQFCEYGISQKISPTMAITAIQHLIDGNEIKILFDKYGDLV